MDFSPAERSLIEERVAAAAPSLPLAYALWFFFGWASAHRFYMRRPRTAVLQILSYFVLVGVAWWLLDGLALSRMIAGRKSELRVAARAAVVSERLAELPARQALLNVG